MNTTTVKERPILFAGRLVRAILEGRKTQTRRVIRCAQPDRIALSAIEGMTSVFPNQFGEPGDRLWVRETWREYEWDGEGEPVKGGKLANDYVKWIYRADYKPDEVPGPWRPSIFMPRAASRILLEVVKRRVERLQEITPAEIKAEGLDIGDQGSQKDYVIGMIGKFAEGWDQLNAKRGYCWDMNPWVRVIEFRRIAP